MERAFRGPQVVIRPDAQSGIDPPFYSFNQGKTHFEVSARELADALEQEIDEILARSPALVPLIEAIRATPADGIIPAARTFASFAQYAAALATLLRLAVASGKGLNEVPIGGFKVSARKHCFTLFERGRFRITSGAEPGSELILQDIDALFNSRRIGGVHAIFWSGSRSVMLSQFHWVA